MNDLRRSVVSGAALLGLLCATGLPLAASSLADPGPGNCSLADLIACAEENAASPPSGNSDVPGGNTDGGSSIFFPTTGGPPQVGMQVGGSDSFIPSTGGPPEVGTPG